MGTCCCNTPDTPPGIWGPNDPRPTPPIYLPPPGSGLPPLVIWGPNDPRPTPPIWLPPDPDLPPVDPELPAGVRGPVSEDYAPPPNDGTNYFLAAPLTVLPEGPSAYLVVPLYTGKKEGK